MYACVRVVLHCVRANGASEILSADSIGYTRVTDVCCIRLPAGFSSVRH